MSRSFGDDPKLSSLSSLVNCKGSIADIVVDGSCLSFPNDCSFF